MNKIDPQIKHNLAYDFSWCLAFVSFAFLDELTNNPDEQFILWSFVKVVDRSFQWDTGFLLSIRTFLFLLKIHLLYTI